MVIIPREAVAHKFLRNQGGLGRCSRVGRRRGGFTVVHRQYDRLHLHQKTRRNTFNVTNAGEHRALVGESESQHYNFSSSLACFGRKFPGRLSVQTQSGFMEFSTLSPAIQPGMSLVSAQANLGCIFYQGNSSNPSLHDLEERHCIGRAGGTDSDMG